MITLTAENVEAALREVVAETGEDYKFSDEFEMLNYCYYVADSRTNTIAVRSMPNEFLKPACLVGRVLHKLGIPLNVMLFDNLLPAIGLLSGLIQKGWLESDNSIAFRMLERAQITQDRNGTFGEALKEALCEV